MERNADDMPNSPRTDAAGNDRSATNAGGSYAGSSGLGNSGDISGSTGYGAGAGSSSTSYADSGTQESQGLADRASDVASSAKDRLADVGSNVKDKAADLGSNIRERAGTAKNSLADMLESGADKLRHRNESGGTLAGATAGGGTADVANDKVAQATDKLAGGMQATADWLRQADLDGLRTGIETQVKEHPGRTLLIALGAGYLLGKAFRK